MVLKNKTKQPYNKIGSNHSAKIGGHARNWKITEPLQLQWLSFFNLYLPHLITHIMRKVFFTTLCVLFISTLQAQVKKAITHESMTMMKRVGAPEVAPDGKWAVFTVTEPSYIEKDVVNDLWIVST